jgi:hypothetical protein
MDFTLATDFILLQFSVGDGEQIFTKLLERPSSLN